MKRKPCPQCRAEGRDSKGDNLVVYHDHEHCYSCGYDNQYNNNKTMGKRRKFTGLPEGLILCSGIPWRNITKETCERCNVKELLLLDDNEYTDPSGVVLFPFYSDTKSIIGYKLIDYYARYEEGLSKHDVITVEGSQTLGGLHMIDYSKSDLCIWEGEIDWLTAQQVDDTRNHVWLPGTQSFKYIKDHALLIRKFKTIYIGSDNDEAGDELTSELLNLLPTYKTKIINFNEFEADDLSDCIETHGAESYFTLISTATSATQSGLLFGDALSKGFLSYFSSRRNNFKVSTGFDLIDEMLGGGLAPSEFVLFTAETGLGKSTLVANIGYNLIRSNHKIMWIGTEMQPFQMMIKFAEQYLHKKIFQLTNGSWSVSDKELQDVLSYFEDYIVFHSSTNDSWSDLHDSILSAIYTHDVRVVFIDVINDISGMDDWQTTQKIMKSLESLASGDESDNRPPITILGVCHQKDVQGQSSRKVSLNRMAGGKAMRQKATCILGMEGNVSNTNRQIKLLKMSRMEGSDVFSGYLEFDRDQRIYYEYEEDEEQTGDRDEQDTTIDVDVIPVRDRKNTLPIKIHSRFSSR